MMDRRTWLRWAGHSGCAALLSGCGSSSGGGGTDLTADGRLSNPSATSTASNRRRFGSLPASAQISIPGWLATVGSGGKRVYVLPSRELVIARLGRSASCDDGAFLRAITV